VSLQITVATLVLHVVYGLTFGFLMDRSTSHQPVQAAAPQPHPVH